MKKKIVRKKTTASALDDQELLRQQRAKAEEMKRRQADEAAARARAEAEAAAERERAEEAARARAKAAARAEAQREATARAEAEREAAARAEADQARRAEETRRRRVQEKKRRDDDDESRRLEEEKRALEEEKRRIQAEKERLERERQLDLERRKLEEERRKLEEERRKLEQLKNNNEEEEPDAMSPDEIASMLADANDDMPPARPVNSRRSQSLSYDDELPQAKSQRSATPAKVKKATPLPAASAKSAPAKSAPAKPVPVPATSRATQVDRATPNPKAGSSPSVKSNSAPPTAATVAADSSTEGDEREGVKLLLTPEAQPESVKDWISDIQGGVPWRKIATYYVGPAAFGILFLVYFSSMLSFKLFTAPKLRDNRVLWEEPTPYALGAAVELDPDSAWLAIGPLRIPAPKDGPAAVIWHEQAEPIEYLQKVTLIFEGWRLTIARHAKDSIIKYLNRSPQTPPRLITDYAQDGFDNQLVEHVMATRPDRLSWFTGPSGVRVFKAQVFLKDALFPEIRNGLRTVEYGGAKGFFFGDPGRSIERVEIFDAAGVRYSYLFEFGTVERALGKLKNAQPAPTAYQQATKSAFNEARTAFEQEPQSHRKLMQLAMYGAGLAIGEQISLAEINSLRASLSDSPFDRLNREKEDARTALDRLRSKELMGDLVDTMVRLLAHPDPERRKLYMELVPLITNNEVQVFDETTGRDALRTWWKRQPR